MICTLATIGMGALAWAAAWGLFALADRVAFTPEERRAMRHRRTSHPSP